MKWLASLILIALSLTIIATLGASQGQSNSIVGRVVDLHNKPIAGVLVGVRPMMKSGTGNQYSVRTDSRGRFGIAQVPYGKYVITALADETGTHGFPSENRAFTTIAITPYFPFATITLRMGSQSGFLTGTVRDAVSGEPVTAGLDLQTAIPAAEWTQAGIPDEFWIPVPPHTDLSMTVSAPGYQTWSYTSSPANEQNAALSLGRGERKRVEVTLQRGTR